MFSDIDECQRPELSQCDENARCENTDGAYQCICNDGYDGTGAECWGNALLYYPLRLGLRLSLQQPISAKWTDTLLSS